MSQLTITIPSLTCQLSLLLYISISWNSNKKIFSFQAQYPQILKFHSIIRTSYQPTRKARLSSQNQVSSMFPVVLLTLLLYVLQQASSSLAQASETTPANMTDRATLFAIKASLSNQQGAIASWNATTDFCRWQGVSCGIKHKDRVVALNLASEGLAGTISPSIGNLTFLRTLDLSWNNLHGEIPSAVGRLSRLRHLDLSNNSFYEVNANLKNCTSLESIDLNSNRLTGEIPAWLGGLSSLKAIHLQKNNFSGIIPLSMTNLSALKEIYFTYNKLEGSLPEGLGRLHGLEFLALGGNHLSGTIPTTLFNLSSLTHLSVTMNELYGMLPPDLGNRLPKLQYLLLGINHFTGSLPSSLANATQIYSLDISFNNFTGNVHPEIGQLCPDFLSFDTNQLTATTPQDWKFVKFLTNCTRLRIFDLQDNMLGATLPSSVTNLSSQLQFLYLGFNEISGKIPFGISNLVSLTSLQFSNNQLFGVVPDDIGRLNSLQALGLENNQLTGPIPSTLGNLTQLLQLYTHNNMFEGSLPRSLGSLQGIIDATFNNNKFTGPLPIGIFNLSSLSETLDLSGNYFVGPLLPDVGSLKKLAKLKISRNNLSGLLPDALSNCDSMIELHLDSNSFDSSIPASITKMRALLFLNLTKNTLSGAIPQEIGVMDGMKELYLSHNNLSGHIPESFENMTSLYRLDLSFNHLSGNVPTKGVFSNVTGLSLDGNMGAFVAADQGFHFIDDRHPRVSYADLVQGTNGFHTSNLIGRRTYGSVYKCSLLLKNTMTTVAVKVFDLQQSGSSKSFTDECEALNKIRHRNLISVITCCSSSDSNQNDFKALVFEFMSNRSLYEWLHMDVRTSQQREGLTLMERLNISVDVADALDYLHNNCEPPIVHCDLKPSNILLDQDLVAHVGDFGLAKILFDSASEQLINSKGTTGIRGTIGYVAPEDGEGGQISPCGDVYSFGIVILELFTGMAPTHDMFSDGLTLKKHVENAFPGMLVKLVDPVLLSVEEAYASNSHSQRNALEDISNVLLPTIKLALSCSMQAQTERMCIRDAAAEMRRIRNCHVQTRKKEEAPTT